MLQPPLAVPEISHRTPPPAGLDGRPQTSGAEPASCSIRLKNNMTKTARAKTKSAGHETSTALLPQHNCFGCGPTNEHGLRLDFNLGADGKSMICRFKLAPHYVGPPGHAHGGIIATILDEAMGKANKIRHIVALTREMTVEYLRPVPLGKPLIVEGRNRRVVGRLCTNVAEIRTVEGEVLARSQGKFIAIDAEKMFARYVAPKSAESKAGKT